MKSFKQYTSETHQLDEGIKDKLMSALLKIEPVVRLLGNARLASTVVAVELLAMPIAKRILDRANYDSIAKVVDLVDFLRDNVATLISQNDPSTRLDEQYVPPLLNKLLVPTPKCFAAEPIVPGVPGILDFMDDDSLGYDASPPWYYPPDDRGWVWDSFRGVYGLDTNGDGRPDIWYYEDMSGEGYYENSPPWEPPPYTPIDGPLLSDPDWDPNSVGDQPPPTNYPDFGDRLFEVYKDSGLGDWFHSQSAGGEPGWDRYNTKGEKVGKCGDSKEGDPYAACLSKQKADKLGKDGIGSFVRRKRKAQKSAGDSAKGGEEKKGQKPTSVATKADESTLREGRPKDMGQFVKNMKKKLKDQ